VPLDSELPAARTVHSAGTLESESAGSGRPRGRVTVAGAAAAGATDGPALMIVTVTVHWQNPGRATVTVGTFK
jgi:hypothetical protein